MTQTDQKVIIIPATPLFSDYQFVSERYNKEGKVLAKLKNAYNVMCVKVWFEDEKQYFWFNEKNTEPIN